MSEANRIEEPARDPVDLHPQTPAGASAQPAPAPPKRWTRRVLMLLIPALVVAVALYAYVHSGRYVSTENAYVKAAKVRR